MKVLYTSYRKWAQSWFYEEHREYYRPNGTTQLLRVAMRRNAYDEQSYVNLESWSPSQGWLTYTSIGVEGTEVEKVSYVQKRDKIDEQAFVNTAKILWEVAQNTIVQQNEVG